MAQRGVERGVTLTRRLLAFSRRQTLSPRAVDLNKLVGDISEILRRTLGENVELQSILSGGLWRTYADANQIESALVNLAVNARDAMPKGGKLTIETQNVYLDAAYARVHSDVKPGQYVMMAVSDTGVGMPADVLARAFEPFFTTKEVGKGTGLGLSQVYGFVKQSGGHVNIYSEPGLGTTIKIYLPRQSVAEEPQTAAMPQPLASKCGSESILVVEDDDDVRRYAVQALADLGYHVLEAANAEDAMRLAEGNPQIQLLFTDVGLPRVNGRQLAEQIGRHNPGLKVLYASGYARNAIVHNGVLDPGVELLAKPYSIEELARRVRQIFDARAYPDHLE
jgi:CheY-like chemotaxis protein